MFTFVEGAFGVMLPVMSLKPFGVNVACPVLDPWGRSMNVYVPCAGNTNGSMNPEEAQTSTPRNSVPSVFKTDIRKLLQPGNVLLVKEMLMDCPGVPSITRSAIFSAALTVTVWLTPAINVPVDSTSAAVNGGGAMNM